ncbi:uncharacterized protein LOC121994101 isoform X1 [Zingiber officinale]|uniref:uncharacterized protein LOC121994101 isoform X1 n=1 Tax=Zingiber officinale TaxID=94328 RepID=UPI001C4C1BFC|nr:uncharacterized protein LOC121994101 isoform X1 [Zingiber officinale]
MKTRRYLLLSAVSLGNVLLIASLIFCSIPGSFSTRAIILRSIQIYNTHEFLAPHPTIYFFCKGENKTILPDVKERHFFYNFKGKESWQPLTVLSHNKCKRCGLYESDRLKSDDVFDEWELCPDDFLTGISIHYKSKEFNATLECDECKTTHVDPAQPPKASGVPYNKKLVAGIVIITVFICIMSTLIVVSAYKYWQRRKRERDQARFLKLFEDGDDIEDELGLGL